MFVELEEGVEGLIHVSQLSNERVDKPQSLFQPGQEIEAEVAARRHAERKIALSIKALRRTEEREEMESYLQREREGARFSFEDILGDELRLDRDEARTRRQDQRRSESGDHDQARSDRRGGSSSTRASRAATRRSWSTPCSSSMVDALRRGERIEIRGFGSFVVKQRRAREGRNPKTGRTVSVAAKRVPFFKVGKELKLRVDGKPLPEMTPSATATPGSD